MFYKQLSIICNRKLSTIIARERKICPKVLGSHGLIGGSQRCLNSDSGRLGPQLGRFHAALSYNINDSVKRNTCNMQERLYHTLNRLPVEGFRFTQQTRGMAGHNKWSNIKHIKQAKDTAKQITFERLARKIKLTLQMGKGSADPKLNPELAFFVDQAKKANMPISRIESIIKAAVETKEGVLTYLLEARGPGNCLLLIDILTDNINRSKAAIKFGLKKHGVIAVNVNAKHAFDYKGVINVVPSGELTLENAVDVAIEIGAEDVKDETDDDGSKVLQFLCEPTMFYATKTALESKGYELKVAGLKYTPKMKVALSDEQLAVMSDIFDFLSQHPDVNAFYDNIE